MVEFDVVELPDADHPRKGETAPDFERPLVTDEYWSDVQLSALTEEEPVLLVFYPMDGSFPATYVWNELRDRTLGEYLTVVGLSISTPYAHKRLIEQRGMSYRLFSDPSNEVAERYGIDHELDGMAGIAEPRPATFLLAEDRTVEYVWVAQQWPEFPDYDELESAVRRLDE